MIDTNNVPQQIALIAGAGPAGLTAAYELLKRTDILPIVCEATTQMGGLSRTGEYSGNKLDLGGHRFYTKSQRVLDWWFSILPLESVARNVDKATSEQWGEIEDSDRIVEYLLSPEEKKHQGTSSTIDLKRYRRVRHHAPSPEFEDDVMLSRSRPSRIYFNKVFFPYPLSISPTVARRLGLFQSLLYALSYIKAHLFPIPDETYLNTFFINRFGYKLYRDFFRDYTEKVWGVPCSSIRADWGAQRIKSLSLKVALKTAILDIISKKFRDSNSGREVSLINHFYYPKYGPGHMWESVAKKITYAGSNILLQHKVNKVFLEDNKVVAISTTDNAGSSTKFDCDYFFSTVPLDDLINMLDPQPPDEVIRIANGLIYRDFMTVGLTVKRLTLETRSSNGLFAKLQEKVGIKTGTRIVDNIPDNWIYIQDGSVKVGRIQVYNNWSPYLLADPNNTISLGLEYFVNEGDDLWQNTDAKMIQFAIDELEQIAFINSDDVIGGHVERVEKAYPAYFGTYDELGTIYQFIKNIDNLFLLGRNGLHRYNNQDHSMMTAMLAVDLITMNSTDKQPIFECNIDSDYQEENPRSPTAPRI